MRVRDYCHHIGKCRRPAHEDCNINFQDSHVIPIVFHNLNGCASHYIIKNRAKDFEGIVDLLPVNKGRYLLQNMFQIIYLNLDLSVHIDF